MRQFGQFARFASVLLWMALIIYWSGQSDLPIDHPPISQWLGGAQHRLAHIAAFAVLAALVRIAFGGARHAALWSWLLVVGFAVTDEWHQSFTPGRRPSLDDVLVDSGSAFVAVLFVDALLRHPHQRWGWRSPVLARTVLVALLVVGIAPAMAPQLPLAGRAGQRVAHANEVLQVRLNGHLIRLEAAGDRLVEHTRARAGALVDGLRRRQV